MRLPMWYTWASHQYSGKEDAAYYYELCITTRVVSSLNKNVFKQAGKQVAIHGTSHTRNNSSHHRTHRVKLPSHSKHKSGKSITLDNGATLTFTLIASWHDMGTKMGSANRRRKDEREDAA